MSDGLIDAINASTAQVMRLAEAIEGMTVILAADMGEQGEQEDEPVEPLRYLDGSLR